MFTNAQVAIQFKVAHYLKICRELRDDSQAEFVIVAAAWQVLKMIRMIVWPLSPEWRTFFARLLTAP
jgi:hypothetical protein